MRHVRLGAWLSAGTGLVGLLYVAMLEDHPDRVLLLVLMGAVVALSASIFLLPLDRLVRHPRGLVLFYAWSTSVCGLIALSSLFDGSESPLALLYFLPLVYAAMAYPPLGVLVLGVVVIGAYLATSSLAGIADPARLFLFVGGQALVTLACAVAARNHTSHYQHQAALARRLADLADYDGLTNCLNHRAFHERLHVETERACRHNRPLGLLVIDLDDFKAINDGHGHPTGDAVLAAIGQTLRGAARISDVVGRVGGDEFAVLLPETEVEDATQVAERMRANVAALANPLPISVSIGVSAAPALAGDAASLVEQADEAVYRAKHAGRNQVAVFGDAPDAHKAPVLIGTDLALHRRIREVVANRSITTLFQPVVSLRDGHILGYEALSRIDGSNLGPDRWLDIAEQVGVRDDLELAMWEVALSAGPPPDGAVLFLNASPGALMSGVLDDCRSRLPANVTIEVSEQQAIRDYALLTRSLGAWTDSNVRVAVDDMGAGHANLRHVLNLAPHYLKLDRALVADLGDHPARSALVESMTRFADKIGSYVIAEGVETAEEAAALVSAGVVYAQGFLLAPPAPPWAPVTWRPSRQPRARDVARTVEVDSGTEARSSR
ncbi:MAG TPA: diguanylate cyclase [Egibacteraceae bacterium]|nr:diguanylate cyclase [Egibacteraceae bacterium]